MWSNLKPTLFADNWDTVAHIALITFQCKPNVVGLSVILLFDFSIASIMGSR